MSLYQIARYPFELSIHGHDSARVESCLHLLLRAFQPVSAYAAVDHDPQTIVTPVGTVNFSTASGIARIDVEITTPDQNVVTILGYIEPEIVNQAIRESAGLLWVHGACLVRDDRCILLTAETGTGKTTLSLGLLHHGFRLLTDDITLIDLHSRQIVPVPRCPKVRPPAPSYLHAIGFDLNRVAEKLDRYVLLPREYFFTAPGRLPFQHVYLLQRRSDLPAGDTLLDITSGILGLLSRSNLLAIDPQLATAHEIFKDTRFTSMNLSDYRADLTRIVQQNLR